MIRSDVCSEDRLWPRRHRVPGFRVAGRMFRIFAVTAMFGGLPARFRLRATLGVFHFVHFVTFAGGHGRRNAANAMVLQVRERGADDRSSIEDAKLG